MNNSGNALAAAVYLAYIFALSRYKVYKELAAGKGFADLVYVPVHPDGVLTPVVIELKHNSSITTGKALQQIENKEYFHALDGFNGRVCSSASIMATTRSTNARSGSLRSKKNGAAEVGSLIINYVFTRNFYIFL